jgi:hypothetical protein
LSVRVHVGLLFEPGDESACSLQYNVEIVDAEEQEETITRRPLAWTHQGWMLVRAPLVDAEQDGSIRIQDLTKVVMARRRPGLAEERLLPFEAAGNVAYADDCPCAFHSISAVGLTTIERIGNLRDGRDSRRGRAGKNHESNSYATAGCRGNHIDGPSECSPASSTG